MQHDTPIESIPRPSNGVVKQWDELLGDALAEADAQAASVMGLQAGVAMGDVFSRDVLVVIDTLRQVIKGFDLVKGERCRSNRDADSAFLARIRAGCRHPAQDPRLKHDE